MITTSEQMREAAMDACKKVADEAKSYGFPQMTIGANTCYDAICAIPIAPQPVAVTVKPLVWGTFGKECLRAETVLGRYEVMWGFHNGQTSLDIPAPRRSHAWHSSVESAKAAAQADYDARIMSALTIHPADQLSDPRVVALVEALEWIEDYALAFPDLELIIEKSRAALRAIGGEA